jgi:hypothetical protein
MVTSSTKRAACRNAIYEAARLSQRAAAGLKPVLLLPWTQARLRRIVMTTNVTRALSGHPMLRMRLQRAVSLVIAARMLLAGIMPIGVRHIHADGDAPHRHEHQCCHTATCHSHCHDECHGHSQCRHSDHAVSRMIAEAVAHIHVNFFGFDFTWPVPDSKSSDGDCNEGTSEVIAAFRPVDWAIGGQNLPPVRDLVLTTTDWLDESSYGAYQHDDSLHLTAPISRPLCDAARGERTGVFII